MSSDNYLRPASFPLSKEGQVTTRRFVEVILQAKRAPLALIAYVAPAWLERQYERFELWATSLGLRKNGHSSLDYRLRDAEVVRDYLLVTLREVNEYLGDRKPTQKILNLSFTPVLNYGSHDLGTIKAKLDLLIDIFTGRRPPFEDADRSEFNRRDARGASSDLGQGAPLENTAQHSSDSGDIDESSDSTGSSVHETAVRYLTISDRLDSLFNVAFQIRNQTARPSRSNYSLFRDVDPRERAAFIRECEQAETYIVRYVHQQVKANFNKSNHPDLEYQSVGETVSTSIGHMGSLEDLLIKRIGKANARRRQQLSYWQKHAKRIANAPESSLDVEEDMQDLVGPDESAPRRGPLSASQPVTQSATFQDLGQSNMGRSQATSATWLDPARINLDDKKSVVTRTSRISTAIGPSGEKLTWPDPPKEIQAQEDFICPYCATLCPSRYLEKDAWRVHLIRDLQPYVCTYENCDRPNELFGSRSEWIHHEDHEHTSIYRCPDHASDEFVDLESFEQHVNLVHADKASALLSYQMTDLCQVPSSVPHRCCPFCGVLFSDVDNMHKHIAYHLERYALLALSRINDIEDESLPGDDEGSHPDTADAKGQKAANSREGDFEIISPLTFPGEDLAKPDSQGEQATRAQMLTEECVQNFNSQAASLTEAKPQGSVQRWVLEYDDRYDEEEVDDDVDDDSEPSVGPELRAFQLANAVRRNDRVRVLRLLKKGMDVNSTDANGYVPLEIAAMEDNEDLVRLLLRKGADIEATTLSRGMVLNEVAWEGKNAMVRLLLDLGADINSKHDRCGSPLGNAVNRGHEKTVELLISRGAEINATKSGVKGAYGGAYGTALHTAVAGGLTRIARILLENGADLNFAGDYEEKPIVEAAISGQDEAVELLLQFGANVNEKSAWCGDAIRAAAITGENKVIEVLLRHGADLNVGDSDPTGPILHLAVYSGHVSTVQLLLEKGVDVNQSSVRGTALHVACGGNHQGVVDVLLEYGADVDLFEETHQLPDDVKKRGHEIKRRKGEAAK